MRILLRSAGSLLCLLGLAFAWYGFVGLATVEAQGNSGGMGRCSVRTLSGAYGIKFEGQKLEAPNAGLFASVSRVTFNGRGQFTSSEIGRLNGLLIQRTFTGPYVVNEDCTGFLDFSSSISNPPHMAHGELVIVNNGQEFFVLDNEDGWVASGVGKKM